MVNIFDNRNHVIIDKKNKIQFDKWIEDKNRQFTEETQIVIVIWENIQCHWSQWNSSKIKRKFEINLFVCLRESQKFEKTILNGGKMGAFSNHCWW